jgi:quercetin dioxygenase-like cupin family protein
MSSYVDWSAVPFKDLFPGIRAQLVSGEKLMLARVHLEPNGIVPPHSHPHEQFGFIVEGEVEFTIGGETRHLKPGDYYTIPGGVQHSVKVGPRAAIALDIFSPPREDYLALPDA